MALSMQRTVEVPTIQFIDKIVDVPVVMQRSMEALAQQPVSIATETNSLDVCRA